MITYFCFLLIKRVSNLQKYPESTGFRGASSVRMNLNRRSRSMYLLTGSVSSAVSATDTSVAAVSSLSMLCSVLTSSFFSSASGLASASGLDSARASDFDSSLVCSASVFGCPSGYGSAFASSSGSLGFS